MKKYWTKARQNPAERSPNPAALCHVPTQLQWLHILNFAAWYILCLLGLFYFLSNDLFARYSMAFWYFWQLGVSNDIQAWLSHLNGLSRCPGRRDSPATYLDSETLLIHGERFARPFTCVSFMTLKSPICTTLPSLVANIRWNPPSPIYYICNRSDLLFFRSRQFLRPFPYKNFKISWVRWGLDLRASLPLS